MAQPAISNNPSFAITLKLMAVFLFMVMAAMIKVATQNVPSGEAVFFRSLFAIPVITFWIWQRGELREGLVPKNLMGHVWRGLFGTSAMALNFAGLGLLPLPEVTAIGYATPIFTVILAAVMLNERIRLVRISAVALGLIGVMIVMWPRLSVSDLTNAATIGALMVLGSSILRALVQVHVRQLVRTEHTAAIVFWFSVTATVLSLLTLPFGWVVPKISDLALLIGAGVIGGVAQILVTSSYRFGAASMLAPFDYASMLFAIVIGWVVFAELPTAAMLLGGCLVIAGGALIIWRERQLGLKGGRARARSVTDPKA
ncbi:DMT family transporter [Aliishimia ponticola]|uniref:DMT family transporter n=1 Tax=Aliishimia ponticola TaxID=2499833 RepID=A0A4S4N6J7_9RHOB|nr:DMT family transporter [Aliishimia ponticola]THH34764.1 DMT family transporter [Aliishimia ponticola]